MINSSIGSSPEEIMLKKALRQRAQPQASKAPSYITQHSSIDSDDGEKDDVIEKVELTAEDAAQLAAEGINVKDGVEIDDYDDDYGEFMQYETKIALSKNKEETKKPFDLLAAKFCATEGENEDKDSEMKSYDRNTLSPLDCGNKNPLNISERGEFASLSSPPSIHSLNPVEAQKYFGEPARGRFHSRCHWIRKQCDISNIKSTPSPNKKNLMKAHRPMSQQGSLSPLKQKGVGGSGSSSRSMLFSRGSPPSRGVTRTSTSRQQTASTMIMFEDQDDPDAERYKSGEHQDTPGADNFCTNDELSPLSASFLPRDGTSAPIQEEPVMENTDLSLLPDESRLLFEALRAMTPDLSKTLGPGSGLTEPSSPRSAYIVGCVTHRLNPRASLMVRKKMTRELQLGHYGMVSSMSISLLFLTRMLTSYFILCRVMIWLKDWPSP